MPRCKLHRLLAAALMAVAGADGRRRWRNPAPSPQLQAFRDIYRELVEIDTTDTTATRSRPPRPWRRG